MLTTVRGRLGLLLTLVALLFGLAVWYGSLAPAPALGAYPSQEHLATDYDRYLGERVTVDGSVQTTDPVTITAEYGAGQTIRLTVTGLSTSVSEGETLRVYGVVEPDSTIRAINAFTVPRRGLWYTWTVSFVAGLWVLGRIIRYWKLDTGDWTLEPRAAEDENA